MPSFAAGAKTGAGNTTWPSISVFSSALVDVQVMECGVFNTSSTAFDVRVARISSGPGTVGAGLVEAALDNPLAVAAGAAFTTHTGGTPTMTDAGYRASIGPNSGVIFTFSPAIEVQAAVGTANGLCVVTENGTGQAAQAYFKWIE